MTPNRFLSYEWDAIAGIVAAAVAIVLHTLHIADEQIILPIVLGLLALLFINFMRHTRNNEHTAEQVAQIQKMVAKVKSSLAVPDVVLIGPRHLRTANDQFTRNMRGDALYFNVCLSMYRTQPLFDALLRPAIENPHVTSIQFVLDEKQKHIWQTEVQPLIMACDHAGKVLAPRWCALNRNLSYILADTQPEGPAEALLSFWGEPFMSQSTERDEPRYIFHVHAHSELVSQLVEVERNCRIHADTQRDPARPHPDALHTHA